MDQFRLLKRTRQATEYSCGASALQAVLSYWGRDVDEAELMKLMNTNPEEGTYPEDMVRGARSLGFEAEAKENLTLDEVEKFTASGDPMIALAQVWRSQRISTTSVEDDWDNGHWIVVLGVDKDYVYFEDPYVRMSKAFVPRKTFEEHWHQAMGGDLTKNPKLMHLGILIRGKQRTAQPPLHHLNFSPADFNALGSLNLMVLQFSGFLLPYDLLDELRDFRKSEYIRPNAFIFLRKDKEGNLSGMEGSTLEDEHDVAEINAVIAAITSRSLGSPDLSRSKAENAIRAAAAGDFGLSDADIRRIGEKLPPQHSAIIVLFENVWERRFRAVVSKHGGGVIAQRLISPEALARAAAELIPPGSNPPF
jgi:predicted double-glycine peptidase